MNDLALQTSLRDLCFIFFKRKWSILAILLVTAVSALVWIVIIRDNIFEATAKVLVKIGHEQAMPPTVLGERPMMIVGQRYQDVNSEVEILTSNDLLGRLVDELGLDKPGPEQPVPPQLIAKIRYYAKRYVKIITEWKDEVLIKLGFRLRLTPREKAIAMLQAGLLVTPQKDSNVLVVRLFLPAREYLSAIVNKLVDLYREFRLSLFLDTSVQGFFESQVKRGGEELEAAERRLHEFESQWDIRAVENQKEVLLRQIGEARVGLTGAELALSLASAKVERLPQRLDEEKPDFAALGAFEGDSFPGKLMIKLADLQEQLELLRTAPVANSELIRANRAQAQLLLEMIASNLRADRSEKELAFRRHQTLLEDLTARLDALHAREMTWRGLKREVQVLEGSHLYYQTKLQEASATTAMEQQKVGNVEILEHGIDPFKPAGTRKITLLGMALAFGLLAALAWVAVLEFFDHAVYDSKRVESRLGVPVLAVVPVVRPLSGRIWSREQTVVAGARRRA
ncbi:MAG: hypothetical protein HY763_14655 [Planctomycetes bacterium]|nr:hypothetical protein [Planctomycetota bacterium]